MGEGVITVEGVGGSPIRTEADLDLPCTIDLSESDTVWLLDLASTCVALDTEEAEDVLAARKGYEEVRTGKWGVCGVLRLRGMCCPISTGLFSADARVPRDSVVRQSGGFGP